MYNQNLENQSPLYSPMQTHSLHCKISFEVSIVRFHSNLNQNSKQYQRAIINRNRSFSFNPNTRAKISCNQRFSLGNANRKATCWENVFWPPHPGSSIKGLMGWVFSKFLASWRLWGPFWWRIAVKLVPVHDYGSPVCHR